ncbi:MAG: glycosyltransferase family 2 protein [Thermodesulfovibrionia bacterium]|nr:glycosyltransferase family 2 protein [Thermodesulfovibrionia bacterium]
MENKIKKKLSIVIPVANESETLERFYKEVAENIAQFADKLEIKVLFIVDNASKDNTREIVEALSTQDQRVHLIWAPQNRSVVDAYLIGFRTAIEDKSDFVLEMDGGYTHLPHEIPLFVNKLIEGYDCVFGSRFIKNAKMKASFKRFFFSRGGTIIANALLGTKLTDTTSGFEAFKADILKTIISRKMVSTGHFFQTEIRFRAKNLFYTEVPINYTNPVKRVPRKYVLNALWGLLVCFIERVRGVAYE